MTFEVKSFEFGVLRLRDIRAGCNRSDLHPGARIGVLVLGAPGEPPYVGSVALTSKRSGRGEHLALLCPHCERGCSVLYAEEGALQCAACGRRLTRRQRERTLVSWRNGGSEEDQLLRAVARKHGSTAPLQRLVEEIEMGDIDRTTAMINSYQAMVISLSVGNKTRR